MRLEHRTNLRDSTLGANLNDHSWMASGNTPGIERRWANFIESTFQLAGYRWCEPNRIRQPSVVKVVPLHPEEQAKRLRDELLSAFELEVLENGISHPADRIVSERLRSEMKEWTLYWLQVLCLSESDPSLASAVLRCVGRQDPPASVEWRKGLISAALNSDSLEIRDAAAQAADSWADPNLIDALSQHSEPVGWLRNFISEVVENLQSEAHVSSA